jgi:hypothetical protein
LSAAANLVPLSLRGEVYDLYLVNAQSDWNDQPSYVFDEWTAYTNGANARQQLGIQDRQETVRYALEFCVYATCVARAANSSDPQTRAFIMWQIERVMKLSSGSEYLEHLRQEPDAAPLRGFVCDYFGVHWSREILGI